MDEKTSTNQAGSTEGDDARSMQEDGTETTPTATAVNTPGCAIETTPTVTIERVPGGGTETTPTATTVSASRGGTKTTPTTAPGAVLK
ncbi:hypothetical protein QQF64_020001 [Cirrhinus molitorella]|uniref:Uncharacterized protein n=1 Tax=Cirrhinus molitorella TaxID=172907 RepID=A0ABR3LIP1_9TELE